MRFTPAIFSAFALLVAGQAMGAAIEVENKVAREVDIATSPCLYLQGPGVIL